MVSGSGDFIAGIDTHILKRVSTRINHEKQESDTNSIIYDSCKL